MPWSKNNYPISWKNFTEDTRQKAIEIANALLEEGYEEERAIAIATKKAEEWAKNRDKKIYRQNNKEQKK